MGGGSKKEEELRMSPYDSSSGITEQRRIGQGNREKQGKLGVSGYWDGVENNRVGRYQRRNKWWQKKAQ